MSYNDILNYVERENKNEDCDYWRLIQEHLEPLPHFRKESKNRTGIEIQVVWETGATSTKLFEALKKYIPDDLAIYANENNILELDG